MDVDGYGESFLLCKARKYRQSLRIQDQVFGVVLKDHVVAVSVGVRVSTYANVHIASKIRFDGKDLINGIKGIQRIDRRVPEVADPLRANTFLNKYLGAVVQFYGLETAVSAFPCVTFACTRASGAAARPMSITVVHRSALSGSYRAII
jgi:hypothetical protein